MKRLIPHPLPGTPDALMARVGYVVHCVENGRTCYHRSLHDPPFPRFHALVTVDENGMEIDLHFDAQDLIRHQGNHDQPWAYEGGRVDAEMSRILESVCGLECVKQIYHPLDASLPATPSPKKRKRSLFEILFKSM